MIRLASYAIALGEAVSRLLFARLLYACLWRPAGDPLHQQWCIQGLCLQRHGQCAWVLQLVVCGALQVYRCINNGVYRAGFATSQAGYEAAVGEMHQLMATLDSRLGQQRFLLGDR
jgi:hypothetical protein